MTKFNKKQATETVNNFISDYVNEYGTNVIWIASGYLPYQQKLPKSYKGGFAHEFTKQVKQTLYSQFSNKNSVATFLNSELNSILRTKLVPKVVSFGSNGKPQK